MVISAINPIVYFIVYFIFKNVNPTPCCVLYILCCVLLETPELPGANRKESRFMVCLGAQGKQSKHHI